MSDLDDLPELEDVNQTNAPKVTVVKSDLPIGDPQKLFSDDDIPKAMELRSQAVTCQKSEPQKALILISDAIIMFPCSAIYLNTRAQIFIQEGDFQLAIRDLELAYARNMENPQAKTCRLLGQLYADMSDFDKSISFYKISQQLDFDAEIQNQIKFLEVMAAEFRKKQEEFQQKFKPPSPPKEQPSQPKTNQDKLNADIRNQLDAEIRDHPAFETPVFKNLFNTAQNIRGDTQKQQELQSNELLMQIFNDEDFGKKIAEVAKDPKAAAKYMHDANFMKAFQTVMGQFQPK